jgi:deazaflavin-dependent oxidoreductase (nitroreductase family)
MSHHSAEQFLYLTTTGRKTGLPREIEIWFVERESRIYILAEHGYKANWVQNILANPSVTIRLMGRLWQASGRVLEPDRDGDLYAEVRELAREKYGWRKRAAHRISPGARNLEDRLSTAPVISRSCGFHIIRCTRLRFVNRNSVLAVNTRHLFRMEGPVGPSSVGAASRGRQASLVTIPKKIQTRLCF